MEQHAVVKYSQSHEWVAVVGEIAMVGISAYAQTELGEVVFVQLPEVGEELEAGKEAAVVESTKAASDIYAPVSGEVVAINEQLVVNPGILNASPEKEGWLFKISIKRRSELDTLLDHQQYLQLTSSPS